MAASQKLMDGVSGCRIGMGYGDGVAAGSNTTITGITTKDKIIGAISFAPMASSGKHINYILNDEITITAANTVVCATTNLSTSNTQLLVFWIIGT